MDEEDFDEGEVPIEITAPPMEEEATFDADLSADTQVGARIEPPLAEAPRSKRGGLLGGLIRLIGGVILLPFYVVGAVFVGVYRLFRGMFRGIADLFRWIWGRWSREAEEEGVPTFERFFNEDAGRPGPFERIVAHSTLAMRMFQATMGLRFVLFIHAIDAAAELVTNYISGIYQSWKMMRTTARRLQRELKQDMAESLAKDLAVCRVRLGRLFTFSGFYPEDIRRLWPEEQIWRDLNEHTFPVHDVLAIRGHLDEMERDLNLLNLSQLSGFVRRSVLNFFTSLIPNPVGFLAAWKNIFIMFFFMRYPRQDIERMFADLLFHYWRTIELVAEQARAKGKEPELLPGEAFQGWMNFETQLLQRVGAEHFSQVDSLDDAIQQNRRSIQRLMRVLCSPRRFVEPRFWARQDLLREALTMEEHGYFHPRFSLEVEMWLTSEVQRHLRRHIEAPDLAERRAQVQETSQFKKRQRWLERLHKEHGLF